MLGPGLRLLLHAGNMKAKDLTAFLNKYALASPVKEAKAGVKNDAEKTGDEEDANEKALPQVKSQSSLAFVLHCFAYDALGFHREP